MENQYPWIQAVPYKPQFNTLLNSLVVLLLPDSGKLIKPLLYKHVRLNETKIQANNDLFSVYTDFQKLKGTDYIQKMLYLLKIEKSSSFYYIKIPVLKKPIPDYLAYTQIRPNIEPKDIILGESTELFGIEYQYNPKYKLLESLKLQETFKNFKLNSIYLRMEKIYSIVKVKKKWYIYDDEVGLLPIPFEIKKNIIIFGSVKVKNSVFSFNNAIMCTVFYLKYTELSSNKIDVLKECDCDVAYGWRQIDEFCLAQGVCWFDAGMMALMIPLKSRNLFLNPLSKKLNMSETSLYPCTDQLKTSDKLKIISKLTKIDPMRRSGNYLAVFRVLYPLIDKKTDTIFDEDYYYLENSKIAWFSQVNEPLNSITDKINNPKDKIFVIGVLKDTYPKIIKSYFKKYTLTAIFLAISTENGPFQDHGVAFVKCKHGWYLFDNNMASRGKPMIKIETEIIKDEIKFKPFSYSYDDILEIGEEPIKIDLFKTSFSLGFTYCL